MTVNGSAIRKELKGSFCVCLRDNGPTGCSPISSFGIGVSIFLDLNSGKPSFLAMLPG